MKFSVAVNDHQSSLPPVQAFIPRGSVLEPILRKICCNDLQQMPMASAYAGDCALSCSYKLQIGQDVVEENKCGRRHG